MKKANTLNSKIMKSNRIFSFFVLISAMLMSASVWAQSWDAPVKPADPVIEPFPGTWVTPTAGGQYYIYNVGAAQFMGSGRDWGSRTITTTDSIVSPEGTKFAHGVDKNAAIPYSATSIGENGYLRFSPVNTDMEGYITGLVDGYRSWQDGDDSRAGNWQLVPGDNNEFLIHDARNEPYDPNAYVEDDPATEENETEAGLDKYRLLGVDWVETTSYTYTDAWAGTSASGKSYKVAWKFVEATDQVAKDIRSWRLTSKATYEEAVKAHEVAMAIYNARVLLYSTLNEAVEAGVDYSAAAAVYEKADATEKELLAANTQLIVNVKIATSTLPVDITKVLQNPDFEVATATGVLPPGWDITITGQNLGQQNRTDTNPDTGLSITNFIEAWHKTSLGDGVIAQTVYGLPAGVYRLECDASICHDPASGDGSDIVGAGLFIKAGNLRESTSIGTPRLGIDHFTVEFENDGRNEMQFGLFAESTNANWLSADNFKLYYVGELTGSPNYKNLQKYISEVYGIIDNNHLYADTKSKFVAALNEAEVITADATPEECDAAYEKLEGAYEAALASIKVYEAFYDYLQDISSYEATVKGYGWDELAEQLKQKKNTYYAAWEEGLYTDGEVKAAMISLLPEIRQWVNEHSDVLTPGTDLTILLENADFEQGTYNAGWDAADDEVQPGKDYGTTPGWTISSGNITQMNHVVEAYHRKFDINQTIPLPAGIYEISIQGFVRHDGDDQDKSVFYAGTFESQLMQRSDQWNATGFYTTDAQGSPCGDNNKDMTIQNAHGESVMVPNGMSGFYFWEQEKNTEGAAQDYPLWQVGDCYYTNHIKLTLAESQDLTFGVKSLCATDWIIWDNLKIMYLGTAENGLYVENHNLPIESGKSADLKIGLENELTNLVSFQMDLTLPESISIDKAGCSLSSRITDTDQELTIGKLEGQTYRLTSTSFSLTPISGSLGTLMTIKLTATEGATGGKATISNIRFSTSNSERVTLDDESFDIAAMYNVIYKVDNQEYKTVSIAYGADITPESAPEKEGYSFSGWSEIPETMPAHDVVVTGTFSIHSYTLTYKVNGEVYKSETIVYGAAITPESAPEKEGYTFSGWSEIPETMPARNVIVTGSFTVNSYTLTYKVDGEVLKSTSIKYGTAITPEEEPSKEGYTFSGWSEIPETMPAHDVEVTGSFTIGKYTLTYKVDGKDYKSTIVTYGTPLTPESEPTKEGYIFSGWSEIPATMPGHDVVITGRFYLYGDVNTDEEVDVVDVVDIARFVVATPSARFQEKLADLNSDNTVNIADAVTLVNHIAGDQNFVKAKAPRSNGQCQLQLLSSGTDALSLHLDGAADFVAFQFDVNVPDNTDLSAISINGMRKDGHQLLFNKVSENCYRVAALSLSNAAFKGNAGELLHISIKGQPTDDICVNNIHFVTTNGTDVTFDALYISGDVTGIAKVNMNEDNTAIYDLQGRKLSKAQRGVNIINGKKVVIRK